MTTTETAHANMVLSLHKDGAAILDQMTPDDAHLLHMTVGVSGEAGELLDAIKKHVIYRKPLDRENVIEELGDLEFYLEGVRAALDISREETLLHNLDKLFKRYHNYKYTDSSAQERKDKQ